MHLPIVLYFHGFSGCSATEEIPCRAFMLLFLLPVTDGSFKTTSKDAVHGGNFDVDKFLLPTPHPSLETLLCMCVPGPSRVISPILLGENQSNLRVFVSHKHQSSHDFVGQGIYFLNA